MSHYHFMLFHGPTLTLRGFELCEGCGFADLTLRDSRAPRHRASPLSLPPALPAATPSVSTLYMAPGMQRRAVTLHSLGSRWRHALRHAAVGITATISVMAMRQRLRCAIADATAVLYI